MKHPSLHKTPRSHCHPRQRPGELFFGRESEVKSPEKDRESEVRSPKILKLENPIRLGEALQLLLEQLRKQMVRGQWAEDTANEKTENCKP